MSIKIRSRPIKGVHPADESDLNGKPDAIEILSEDANGPFAKYRGIGNPSAILGKKQIDKWIKELRGR